MSQEKHVAAPLTAAALIAQQVAANAIRDALFLTWFPVTRLPLFVGLSAILPYPRLRGRAASSPVSVQPVSSPPC